jgi:single-stranded DNA-binding protein
MFNITLTGYLAADAQAGKDHEVVNFRVGSTLATKDKETIWTNCAIWGKLGTTLLPYLVKGTPVTVMGELVENSMQVSKDGNPFISTKVKVLSINLHGAKAETDRSVPVAQIISEVKGNIYEQRQPKEAATYPTNQFADELPF